MPERPTNINMPKPPPPIEDQASIARGEDLFHWECHMCHGAGAMGGGTIADLRYMTEETHEKFKEITLPNTQHCLPVYYTIAPSECSSNLARFDGVR